MIRRPNHDNAPAPETGPVSPPDSLGTGPGGLETGSALGENLLNLTAGMPTESQLSQTVDVIQECDSLIGSLRDTLLNAARVCINQCADDLSLCQGCILAKVQTVLEQIDPAVSQCANKASKYTYRTFQATVSYLQSLGFTFPTPDVIDNHRSPKPSAPPPGVVSGTTGTTTDETSCPFGWHWVDSPAGRICVEWPKPECKSGQLLIQGSDGSWGCIDVDNSGTGGFCPPGSHMGLNGCVPDTTDNGGGPGGGGPGPGGGGPGGGPGPGGGGPGPGGGGPGGGPGPGGPCTGTPIDPCSNLPANYSVTDGPHGDVYVLKTPVYDACGNLIGCWTQPIPCVPPTDPTCINQTTGCPATGPMPLVDITGKDSSGKCKGTCPKINYICVTCTDPNNCVPPWECPDGWTYNPATGECKQTTTTTTACPIVDAGDPPDTSKQPAGFVAGNKLEAGFNCWCDPNYTIQGFAWNSDHKWWTKDDGSGTLQCLSVDSRQPCGIPAGSDTNFWHYCQGKIDTGGGGPGSGGPGNPPPPPVGECVYSPDGLASAFAAARGPGGLSLPKIQLDDIFNCDSFSSLNPLKYVCQYLTGQLNEVFSAINTAGAILPCVNAQFGANIVASGLLRLFGGWFGAVPDAVIGIVNYNTNLGCQWKIPNTALANQLRVHGWIDQTQWNAAVAANADCIPWQEEVLNLEYNYPSENATIALWRRRYIDDNTFYSYMTRLGFKDQQASDQAKFLSNYVAPPADVVRWNQTQVADDNNAKALSLDDGFEDFYSAGGNAFQQLYGVDHDTAQLQWRRSWVLPGIADAVTAYLRIPESVTVPGSGRTVDPVSPEEMQAVCDLHGLPDGWADRLMYASFQPISIRHLRLLWISGVYDFDTLVTSYRKTGYAPDDARNLAQAIVETTRDAKAQFEGGPTQAEIIRLYAANGLTREDAYQRLLELGKEDDSAQQILDKADADYQAKVTQRNIRVLKKRYLQGRFTTADVVGYLQKWGVASDRVATIVGEWNDSLSLSQREVSAATLCDWATRGLITTDDYNQRMLNLHYSPDDAIRFVQSCMIRNTEKIVNQLTAKAEKAAKQEAAAKKAQQTLFKQLEKQRLAAAKQADPYRDAPKPYRTPRITFTKRETTTTRDVGPPPVTTTESRSESSG